MRWMWIDKIVEFEPGRRLVAIKNVSLAEEHLHDHFAEVSSAEEPVPSEPRNSELGTRKEAGRAALPIMPASLMIEGMAQTAGILVGSVHGFREKVILAKIVIARFDADVFPGDTIRYEATLDRLEALGASTTGIVSRMRHVSPADGQPTWATIGQVDLMFSHLDQNMAGMEFPKENFVFSENFRTILRSAGMATE